MTVTRVFNFVEKNLSETTTNSLNFNPYEKPDLFVQMNFRYDVLLNLFACFDKKGTMSNVGVTIVVLILSFVQFTSSNSYTGTNFYRLTPVTG